MSTTYTYSLYWLDKDGNLQPGAAYALSDSAIRGIYSAQLLLLADNKLSILLNSPFLSFKFVLVNQTGTQNVPFTRETAYNVPLYDLTKYSLIQRGNRINVFGTSIGPNRERIYHTVDINADLSIANQNDNDAFNYLITGYDISKGGIGVKVVASSPSDFLEGFLAYFRWIGQYTGYRSQLPNFHIIPYLNGVRTGLPTMNTCIYPFILDQLPIEIHEMIVTRVPSFRYVNKEYYGIFQRQLPCWKVVTWPRLVREFETRLAGPGKVISYMVFRDTNKIREPKDIISILPEDPNDWERVEDLINVAIMDQTGVLAYLLNSVKDKQKYADYALGELYRLWRKSIGSHTSELSDQILYLARMPGINIDNYVNIMLMILKYDGLMELLKLNKINTRDINIDIINSDAIIALADYKDLDISRYSDRIVRRMLRHNTLYLGFLERKGIDLSIDDNALLRQMFDADNTEIVRLLLDSNNIDILRSPDVVRQLIKGGYNILQNIISNKKLSDTKSIQTIIYDITDPITFEILLAANPDIDISIVAPQIIAATIEDPRLLDLLLNNSTFDPNMHNGSLVNLLVTYNQIDSLRKVINDPRTVLTESNKRSIRLRPELADISV